MTVRQRVQMMNFINSKKLLKGILAKDINMMIMDFGKLDIRYLNTLKLYSAREVRRFNQWNKSNEQQCFEIKDLFVKLENLIPSKVDNVKVHPCATMIEKAFVRGFDDYFDKNYFIEPCQEKGFGIMFKINDKHEYYWKSLFPNKF